MVNFGWHRLTRIRLIKFTSKYQLQKACVSNTSSTGQSGRGLPRNLFHFSCSLSGWDLLNDALKGMSLFATFYYWWEPIWSLLCCARWAVSPGDWRAELEGIRVVQARAPWDNSTRGKKKKAILHISVPITSELRFSFPSPPLLLDCSFFWLASQDKERESWEGRRSAWCSWWRYLQEELPAVVGSHDFLLYYYLRWRLIAIWSVCFPRGLLPSRRGRKPGKLQQGW